MGHFCRKFSHICVIAAAQYSKGSNSFGYDSHTMDRDQLFHLLDEFKIETPSWGYADTGTRFGKFLQPAAASTIEEKLADAGTVHRYTGCCPSVAVHVLWDFSMGVDATATAAVAAKNGVRIGSINPNLFQDQVYKFGSVCSPDESARHHAHRHVMDCIAIAKAVKSESAEPVVCRRDQLSGPG